MQWSHPLPSLQPVPAQDVSSEELALPLFFNEDQPSDGSGFGWPFNGLRYGIFQFEQCPSTKRVHAQGYCQFTKELRLSALKKISKEAHWTLALGTPAQNRAYCSKLDTRIEGTEPIEFSELELATERGKSSSTKEAVFRIRSDPDFTVSNFIELFPEVWVRYPDLIARVRLANNLVGKRDIRVLFIYGKPGIGKSTFVFERYPGAYWKPPGKWWDGYSGQETVVFDDFDGSWFSCSELLRILNPFPTSVEVKGAVFNLSATNFVITSNYLPESWYRQHFVAFPDHKTAVERRINVVIQYLENQGFLRNGWSDLLRSTLQFGIVTGYENETISFHTPPPLKFVD